MMLRDLRRLMLLLLCAVQIALPQSKSIDPTLLQRGEAGDATAEFEIGRAYQKGIGASKDDVKAAEWYQRSADKGNAAAQYELGLCLLYAWGAPRDIPRGVTLLTKAAESQDDASSAAQLMLAQLYEEGGLGKYISAEQHEFIDMVPKNDLLAAKYYQMAANQGIPIAQNHLGLMYIEGRGVPKDFTLAYFWLTLGNAGGSHSTTDGQDDQDLAALHLTKSALQRIQERASKWFAQHPSKSTFDEAH